MGKFIVIYGSNNLGKSTQLDLLEETFKEMGRPYTRIKYPIYESETGRLINQILRGNKEEQGRISEEEIQTLYAENRRDFEPTLKKLLEEGDVLAEDYVGTGLAWGEVRGVKKEFLEEINADLLVPDCAILLDGERFNGGIEKGHRNETAGQEVWETSRRIHLELAAEYGWEVVNANESPEKVHQKILAVIVEKW